MLKDIINIDLLGTKEIIIFFLVGVAAFIYGVVTMGDGLKKVAGQRMKDLISKSTNTPLKGLIVGTLITAVLQSSTGVTVLTVSLVSAGLMTLPQSVGIIMGANIGTTLTTLIIALPIADYGIVLMAIGFILMALFNKERIKEIGSIITGLGLVFFGLEIIGVAMSPLQDNEVVTKIMHTMSDISNPFFWLLGTLFGTIFTAIVQSSTLSMALLQKSYQLNVGGITLMGAVPILLGFNIGTTFSSLFASIGQNKDSKRAAMIHVIFNILGSIIFLIFLKPYVLLLEFLEKTFYPGNRMLTLGMAHTLQNILSAFILFFFTKQMIKMANFLVRDKKQDIKNDEFNLNNTSFDHEPTLALSYAKKGIKKMCDIILDYFNLVKEYTFNSKSQKLYDKAIEYEELLDNYDKVLHDYLIRIVHTSEISESNSKRLSKDLFTIRDIERIGDHFTNLMEFFKIRHDENIELSSGGKEDLTHYYLVIEEMLKKTIDSFINSNKDLAHKALEYEDLVDELEEKFRYKYLERLKQGEVYLNSNNNYQDILSNIERIGDHLSNICESVINPLKVPDAN